MSIIYFPFNTGAGADSMQDRWTKMARLWCDTGVVDEGNKFEVYADNSGLRVKVKSGIAWIRGHYIESDAEEILAIGAADPSNPRIDRVVLRVNWTLNTIALAVLQGAPAASPSAPALTQVQGAMWEISLAQVRVDATVASIVAGKVTDERSCSRGVAEGVAKHEADTNRHVGFWVNFNGTGTIAIRDSHNVMSVTDNGIGDYTVTIDTDFANANWCCTLGAGIDGKHATIQVQTAGTARVQTFSGTNLADATFVCVQGVGDPA